MQRPRMQRLGWGFYSANPFRRRQGECLAFIHLDTQLHRKLPAEPTCRNILASAPPSGPQMALTLEQSRPIGRLPITSVRTRVLTDSKSLPVLI